MMKKIHVVDADDDDDVDDDHDGGVYIDCVYDGGDDSETCTAREEELLSQ